MTIKQDPTTVFVQSITAADPEDRKAAEHVAKCISESFARHAQRQVHSGGILGGGYLGSRTITAGDISDGRITKAETGAIKETGTIQVGRIVLGPGPSVNADAIRAGAITTGPHHVLVPQTEINALRERVAVAEGKADKTAVALAVLEGKLNGILKALEANKRQAEAPIREVTGDPDWRMPRSFMPRGI